MLLSRLVGYLITISIFEDTPEVWISDKYGAPSRDRLHKLPDSSNREGGGAVREELLDRFPSSLIRFCVRNRRKSSNGDS